MPLSKMTAALLDDTNYIVDPSMVRRPTSYYWRRKGGGYSFAPWLSDLTIDHASRSRQSTVLDAAGDTSNIWASYSRVSIKYMIKPLLCISPACLAVRGQRQTLRMAIFFALLSMGTNLSMAVVRRIITTKRDGG